MGGEGVELYSLRKKGVGRSTELLHPSRVSTGGEIVSLNYIYVRISWYVGLVYLRWDCSTRNTTIYTRQAS